MENIEELGSLREIEAIRFSLRWLEPYFNNPMVTDIFIDKGIVSVKEFGKERCDTNVILTIQETKNIIVQIAKYLNKTIDWDNYPVLEGTIPCYEARITGLLSWSKEPVVIIRKRPQFVFPLQDYVDKGQLKASDAAVIRDAIKKRKNILVSGGPGSGKTTFTNAIIDEMAKEYPNDSYFVVEDTSELNCKAKYAELLTVPTNLASKAIELSLRSSPDRIIFGEIRSGKVLKALLDGWNTGCPGGVATIHANTAASTVERMKSLFLEEGITNWESYNSVSLIIHLSKSKELGVYVDEVLVRKH